MNEKIAIRDAYGQALLMLGGQNSRVVALEADVGNSTKSILFGKAYPERYFNTGISEINMVNMAAGLATEGFIPFVNTFAVFMSSRALDPIQSLIAHDHLNVKLCGAYCGLSDSYDGASHHSLTDLAIMRSLPGMTVVSVSDPVETFKAVYALAALDGPAYLRLSRAEAPTVYSENLSFKIGMGIVLREGTDVAILSTGTVLHRTLEAADKLARAGIQATVVDMHTLAPFDDALVLQCALQTECMLTVEEHSVRGGLGSAVAEVLARNGCATKLDILGLETFAESGGLDAVLDKYGFGAENIAARCIRLLEQ